MESVEWDIFRIQAIKAVGLEGHPKANEAYSLAWKTGYEGGTDEVLIHLENIAEILLEVK